MHFLDYKKTYCNIDIFAADNTAVTGLAVTPGAEGMFHSAAKQTRLKIKNLLHQ